MASKILNVSRMVIVQVIERIGGGGCRGAEPPCPGPDAAASGVSLAYTPKINSARRENSLPTGENLCVERQTGVRGAEPPA